MLIFTYGTLMSGLHNHHFLKNSKFIARAHTQIPYVMYGRGIPYVSKEEHRYPITGELYEITADQLDSIDILEGHPNFYKREEIPVIQEDGQETVAWIYFCNPHPAAKKLEQGDYRKHLNEIRLNPV